MKQICMITFAFFLILGCIQQEEFFLETTLGPTGVINNEVKPGAVDFQNLKVGQKSRYIPHSVKCKDGEGILSSYEPDTLLLEVVRGNEELKGEDVGHLMFKETLLRHFSRSDNDALRIIDLALYPVYTYPDRIELPNRSKSALFFFYDNDVIHLDPRSSQLTPVRHEECDLLFENEQIFNGAEIGIVDSLRFGRSSFDDAEGSLILHGKIAVACIPRVYQENAYLVYDQHQLILSYSYSKAAFEDGKPWSSGHSWLLESDL